MVLRTVYFLQNTYLSEMNPLFGPHPSPERIYIEGGLIIASEILLARWLWAVLTFQIVWQFIAAWMNFHTPHHGWH